MNLDYSRTELEAQFITLVKYGVLVFLLFLVLAPFTYTFFATFRPASEFFGEPHLFPRQFTLDPWMQAFDRLSGPLWNSFKIATGTAVLALLITIPSAYVFGRKEFRGKRIAFYLIVVALMFPYILMLIPISSLWFSLNLYNTVPGLWIAYQVFVTPFAIWILRDFFAKLPQNIEEAAQVYGCTQFSAFIRVILPLSLPAVVAVGFVAFLVGWNDFLFSNMLTDGTGPRPAVVVLFIDNIGEKTRVWSVMMAQTLLIGIPPAILYMFSRRYLTNAFAVE